jgi:hypothetical protein
MKIPKGFEVDEDDSYCLSLKKNFEPIIQVLDFMNALSSSKFQVPGPGALVGEWGT